MPSTGLFRRITVDYREKENAVSSDNFLFDEPLRTIVNDGKPVTVWEVAARSRERYIKQTTAILDELTTERCLAKFRVGFNDYYALPKAALTMDKPDLITVISDSLKSLLLTLRYKLMMKPKGGK
jgi:hypothetical protein